MERPENKRHQPEAAYVSFLCSMGPLYSGQSLGTVPLAWVGKDSAEAKAAGSSTGWWCWC